MDLWTRELKHDPDKEFLLDGVNGGFLLLPKEAPIVPAEMHNYFSAINPEVIDKVESTVLEEIHAGKLYCFTSKTCHC